MRTSKTVKVTDANFFEWQLSSRRRIIFLDMAAIIKAVIKGSRGLNKYFMKSRTIVIITA